MLSRRKSRRFEARLEGSYAPLETPRDSHPTVTTNLSASGCTIVTGERTEPIGVRVHLELRIPAGERATFVAAVVWSREPKRASSGGIILPGHSGVAFAIDEPVPPAFAAYLEALAALDRELPAMPHHLQTFLAEALLERHPPRPRSTPAPEPRPLTPTERIRRAVVAHALQTEAAARRPSEPPPEQRPPSQPPQQRPPSQPPRPSQPPPRASQPPPRASQPPPRASQPPPTRPIHPAQSSLGLLPPTAPPPRSEPDVTDEALDRVLREFLVTRSARIRPTVEEPQAAASPPPSLDALLRDFLREVEVPAKALDQEVDRVVDAMLSESTWWRHVGRTK